jgi:nucleotide-binding universal stress UspA family protein
VRRKAAVSLGYRRIVVPIAGGPESERATDVACRLAAEHRASITAVTVIEVPALLPLDAHVFEEEAEAKKFLERAAAIGDSYGVSISPRVVRARQAASAIIKIAKEGDVQMLVLGAARKGRPSRGGTSFGGTVEHVLKHAPCRVMVVAAPAAKAGHPAVRRRLGSVTSSRLRT